MKYPILTLIYVLFLLIGISLQARDQYSYVIVDTEQDHCYNNSVEISGPSVGQPFFGQDAQYIGTPAAYKDNGDGTITDLRTGLMWSKAVDPDKSTPQEAAYTANHLKLAGYTDWRLPSIKELYSLIDFRGVTGFPGSGMTNGTPTSSVPYINTDYFDFLYGDTDAGERFIDAQWVSSTRYVSTTMDNLPTVFGVNFADGRIKGYGLRMQNGTGKTFYVRYVRGNTYDENDFVDNRDGTVTDQATGLTWMKADSGKGMDWEDALEYAENLELTGHHDWRLPNAKELQSIVDYSRSPDTTNSAAIDPVFEITSIENEAGQKDWPFFWTSTTHLDGPNASQAAYVSFGRAIGQMHGHTMDVHGAGAQRSDPKTGTAKIGHGPQGDAQRIQNYVRCVRGGATLDVTPEEIQRNSSKYPNTVRVGSRTYKPEEIRNAGRMAPPNRSQQSGFRPDMGASRGGSGFIKHEDKNGDGKVSRQEFSGPTNHFRMFDKNNDGYITEDEAPTGPPQGGKPPF